MALENAKLFDDIQNIKNYNESMLESMSNGVLTMDEEGLVVTCNAAGQRILQLTAADVLKKPSTEVFKDENAWVIDRIKRNEEDGEIDVMMDAELKIGGETLSTNLTFQPLVSVEGNKLGSMVMLEDISSEKRMKSTMSRYMDPGIADQLLEGAEDMLGGKKHRSHRAVFRHSWLYPTHGGAWPAGHRQPVERIFYNHGLNAFPRKMACSTSLSVMPSWPASAFPLPMKMMQIVRYAQPSP